MKDTYGNTVNYHWDTQKDLLTSVEDGKGTVLSYGYDSADRLTKIGHNGFHYQFFQDAFGNTSTFPPVLCSIPTEYYYTKKGSRKQSRQRTSSGFVLQRSGKMLVSVKGNVSKALSNPKGYRHQINRAIKRHQTTYNGK